MHARTLSSLLSQENLASIAKGDLKYLALGKEKGGEGGNSNQGMRINNHSGAGVGEKRLCP